MKRFKVISTSFVIVIAVIFGCNIYYLVSLYASIRADFERDVITALANADIDEMWLRAERRLRESKAAMEASISAGYDVDVHQVGAIEGVKDEEGNFITTTINNEGDTVMKKMPLRVEKSFTNQMVDDMSRQMHANMDSYIDFDPALMDSVFAERLADRGLTPDFVAVEVVDSEGIVRNANIKLEHEGNDYDVFSLCINPADGLWYRAYITPLST